MSAVERVVGAEGDEVVDPTRVRLVEAAAEVFAEKGYDGAGVQEIARRAGLTTGAIYGRFTGKAELLREAIERPHRATSSTSCSTSTASRATPPTSSAWPAPTSSSAPTTTPTPATPCCSRPSSPPAATPRSASPSRALVEERAARLAEIIEAAKADGSLDPAVDTDAARPLLPRRRPRLPALRRPRRRPARSRSPGSTSSPASSQSLAAPTHPTPPQGGLSTWCHQRRDPRPRRRQRPRGDPGHHQRRRRRGRSTP